VAEGVDPSKLRHELSYLSQIFGVALKDWGIPISSNPAQLLRRPAKAKGRNRRGRRGELALLLYALRDAQEVKAIVQLTVETGMRRSEILALRWENIDLISRYAWLPETKNGDSRAVPLSSRAVQILEGIGAQSGGIVFNTKLDSVSQAFNRACKRARLMDLHFHDLRHEATSRFFEKGLNTMEVSSITGHKTLSMLKRYTHLKAADLALAGLVSTILRLTYRQYSDVLVPGIHQYP
jgi:integrase